MKLHRNTCYILFGVCVISLCILIGSDENTVWNNIGISVFFSALLALIIRLTSYFDSRNKLICDINEKVLFVCLGIILLKVNAIRAIDGDKCFLYATLKMLDDDFRKKFIDIIDGHYFLNISFEAFEYAEVSTEYVMYLNNVQHWLSEIKRQLLYIEMRSTELKIYALEKHGVNFQNHTPYNTLFEQYPYDKLSDVYLEMHKFLCLCDEFYSMLDHAMSNIDFYFPTARGWKIIKQSLQIGFLCGLEEPSSFSR